MTPKCTLRWQKEERIRMLPTDARNMPLDILESGEGRPSGEERRGIQLR